MENYDGLFAIRPYLMGERDLSSASFSPGALLGSLALLTTGDQMIERE